jgi:hypothetical protein
MNTKFIVLRETDLVQGHGTKTRDIFQQAIRTEIPVEQQHL